MKTLTIISVTLVATAVISVSAYKLMERQIQKFANAMGVLFRESFESTDYAEIK